MTNPLMELIGRGEGDYNSYNRGSVLGKTGKFEIVPSLYPVDMATMSIAEIQRRQALPHGHRDRMFAVGRYQLITDTLKSAVKSVKVDGSALFTPSLQDRLMVEYEFRIKRPEIHAYITGRRGSSLRAAQKATCFEWASIEDPDSPGHLCSNYEEKGNRMLTTAADVETVVEEMRAHFHRRVSEGMSSDDAWWSTASMGVGTNTHLLRTHRSGSSSLRSGSQGPAVSTLQRHLDSIGYRADDGERLAFDGRFGASTRHAVESFQRDSGLEADGVAGTRTLEAINRAIRTPSIGEPDAPYLKNVAEADTPFARNRHMVDSLAEYKAFASSDLPSLAVDGRNDEPALHSQVNNHSKEPQIAEEGIRKLQGDLAVLGITNHHGEPLAATGQYSDETRMAVMGFQMDLGLPVSGEPDVATVALADARASIARMQPLRALPMIADEWRKEQRPEPELAMPGIEPVPITPSRAFSDPLHPQHALYADLKDQLPEEISEMRLAQFTSACHRGGIGAGDLSAIQIIDDRAVFVGAMAGFAEVDMNTRPTIEQSVEQAQVFDQQQAMEMNQRAQEMQQSQGMSMSM